MKKTLNERFTDFADWVSEAMGTPANIISWIIVVLIWFLLFAFNPGLQNSNFLPAWFTSNSFNFPLNSITTLAELYIGFLVAAAANRVEKRNKELQQVQMSILKHVEELASNEDEEIKKVEEEIKHEQHTQDIVKHLDKQDEMLVKLLERRGYHP